MFQILILANKTFFSKTQTFYSLDLTKKLDMTISKIYK